MNWNPDEHVDTGGGFTPIDEGEYDFTVTSATEATSKAGNEMIELQMAFDIGRSDPLKIYDRLVNTPKALWKVKDFCEVTGLKFDTGELAAANCIGLQGKAYLHLGQENDKGKRYMEVRYYCTSDSGFSESPMTAKQDQVVEKALTNDDIPF
mgnify:CR=1 FL=1